MLLCYYVIYNYCVGIYNLSNILKCVINNWMLERRKIMSGNYLIKCKEVEKLKKKRI